MRSYVLLNVRLPKDYDLYKSACHPEHEIGGSGVLNMICSAVVLMFLILALIAAYTLKPDHGGGIRAVVVADLSARLRTTLQ